MTAQEKKDKLKQEVMDIINANHLAMLSDIDAVLNSGAIDIESWEHNTYTLPKAIAVALSQKAEQSITPRNTSSSFIRSFKKIVKNIRYFV